MNNILLSLDKFNSERLNEYQLPLLDKILFEYGSLYTPTYILNPNIFSQYLKEDVPISQLDYIKVGLQEFYNNILVEHEKYVLYDFVPLQNLVEPFPIEIPCMGINPRLIGYLAEATSKTWAIRYFLKFCKAFGKQILNLPDKLIDTTIDSFELDFHNNKYSHCIVKTCEEFLAKNEYLSKLPVNFVDQSILAITKKFNNWKISLDQRAIIGPTNSFSIIFRAINIPYKASCGGVGVALTRDPIDGKSTITGEVSLNHEILSNLRSRDIKNIDINDFFSNSTTSFDYLKGFARYIEKKLRSVFRIEFHVDGDSLTVTKFTDISFMSGNLEIGLLLYLWHEKVISAEDIIRKISYSSIESLYSKNLVFNSKPNIVIQAIPGGGSVAVGNVVFSKENVLKLSNKGFSVIYICEDITPADLEIIKYADGLIILKGGFSSHAAVIARGMGKALVLGSDIARINDCRDRLMIGGNDISEQDSISIDGKSGKIFLERAKICQTTISPHMDELFDVADSIRRIQIRANVDLPDQIDLVSQYGIYGVGLFRMEHLLAQPSAIQLFQRVLVCPDDATVEMLEDFLRNDFETIFRGTGHKPIAIRLVDAPLNEFFPADPVSFGPKNDNSLSPDNERSLRGSIVKEQNPMLGLRGARLSIVRPDILEIQIRSICWAVNQLYKDKLEINLEILIPLVMSEEEVVFHSANIAEAIGNYSFIKGKKLVYKLGAMIETPRAAIIADKIAKHVDFLSIGTNDLTQMVMGLSRDDSFSFLPLYIKEKHMSDDPMRSLDQDGVGWLIEHAINLARKEKPCIIIGLCGEHASDKSSINYICSLDIDYISCSLSKVQEIRVVAAKAELCRNGVN